MTFNQYVDFVGKPQVNSGRNWPERDLSYEASGTGRPEWGLSYGE